MGSPTVYDCRILAAGDEALTYRNLSAEQRREVIKAILSYVTLLIT